MIVFIIFVIFILYFFCCKEKKKENFLDRQQSKLSNCSHLVNTINNHLSVYISRKNSYTNSKHTEFGIMRPILFYFWDNNKMSSKNFKENKFESSSLEDCPPNIQQQLGYLVDKTPYGKVRDNLKDLKLPLKNNGDSLFKCDQLYPNDMLLDNNDNFYVFRQTYSDFQGNYILDESSEDFKFRNDIDNQNMESSEEYHNRLSSVNLRILDFDIGCFSTTDILPFCGHTLNKFNKKDNNQINTCCYIDNDSSTNNGIKIYPQSGTTVEDNKCCKNITSLAFVPESYLIMKFIYYAKNEFLQNLTYYGYNDYNITEEILTSQSESKSQLNDKGLISHIPEFILWDGFGVYVKRDSTNQLFYVHIINEESDVRPFSGRDLGSDLKIDINVSDGNSLEQELNLSLYRDSPVFQNFIKNHFHIYRKNGLNFFEYMCLDFLKIAHDNGNDYLVDDGTNPRKYLVRNGQLTEYGFSTARELYKYHVKSETDFSALQGNIPLYDDMHIDYFTLTKWYGNNNCKYYKYKLLYEMENIDYNWEVCDIMKFILNTLYLPYKIMDPTNACYTNTSSEDCWSDKLIEHYNNSDKFNCKR